MICMKKLSNGIRVVSEKLPYFRTATFGVWVQAGSVNEKLNESGTAHMLEHMFFKGTKNKTAKELADSIALIGDDINAFTSKEYTAFYGTTTSGYIIQLIDLIGEMLFESLFDEAEIMKEKRVILDEIDMYEDSPEDIVHDMIQSGVYKGHPLANIISGNKKTVNIIKREHLIKFKEQYYIPSRIVISVAGNYDENMLMARIEELFGGLLEPSLSLKEDIETKLPEYNKCFLYKHKDIEQAHINLALPSIGIGSKKRFIFTIFNSIFGGSNNSRLFQTIREESGLAYSVYSYTSEFIGTGLFHIDVTVNPSKVMEVLNMIKNIINDIKRKGIDQTELDMHKSQIVTELIMGSESTKAKMSHNAKSIFIRNYAISLDENLEGIQSVKEEELNELINEYLNIEQLSLCVAGSKEYMDINAIKKWLSMSDF